MFDKISKYMADMIYSTLDGVDPENAKSSNMAFT